ncbi:MAG: CarD family transcriptional regulator [Clostridia bacterium]|nr:CarD family transcriptional regulator [Clostridia bacterium]
MYNTGDLIVYGASGVCRVGEITQMDGKDYQLLHPVWQKEIIYMPLFSTKVYIREVIERDEAARLLDSACNVDAQPVFENKVQLLSQRYEKIIKSYQCIDLLYLVVSIYNKKVHAEKNRRKLGLVDERYLKKAEDLLFGELSIALDMPRDKVQATIRLAVKKV